MIASIFGWFWFHNATSISRLCDDYDNKKGTRGLGFDVGKILYFDDDCDNGECKNKGGGECLDKKMVYFL